MTEEAGKPARLTAEELFRLHGTFVARFLTQLGVARGAVDDVLQEVFLVVHARGGYVAGPAKPTSYLGSIAVRAAQAYRRRGTLARQRQDDRETDELSSLGLDPEQNIESGEDVQRIRDALASLPEDLRAVLLLVELEGESAGSVAASMNVAVGTIYWRLHTAKKQFRRALGEQEARGAALTTQVRNGWGS